ncbi:MAG TPA: TonB-dependent receptor [Blastocatellia bacterium]|nr:TonB-dependent receptor [Blastocatellia bacterium]
MNARKLVTELSIAVMTILLSGIAVSAQTVGASIQGTVTDANGSALPNATVEVRNVATGVAHNVAVDAEGRYRAPLLPSGDYEVRGAAPGFQPLLRRGVSLAVGQDAVVDLTLTIGQIETTVIVEGEATTVNTVSAALSGLVTKQEIRDLPLNGRSFQQLALLQTGVTPALAAGNDPVGGRTPKISINGARPEQNNFLLDGTDINNVYNKTPGSVAGVLLGVEAILEFRVLTNAYSAEFGRSAGGVINAVTRSGQNRFNGSLFEFHRNSAFDAKNFFDQADKEIPAFKRNQFGGVLGGPIRKDKTHFFAAYEALIERLGITGLASVPDDNARKGLFQAADSSGNPLFNPDGTPKFRNPVPIHPAIPAYLDLLFPRVNGRLLKDTKGVLTGAGEYLFSLSQPTNEHFAQGRIDHQITERDKVWGRYTFDGGNVDRQPFNKPAVAFTKERSRNQYLSLEYQRTFSSGALNTAQFGFNRSVQEAVNQRTADIPANLSFVPGDPFGFINISGIVVELGGDFRLPRLDRLNNFQLADTHFLTRGAHALKFGAQGQRIQFNQNTVSQRGGVLNFANLESFLQGKAISADVALPGLVDPVRGYRQSLFGFFIQDDYKFRSHLTFNLGLRYEFATVPTEVNGKISNLRNVSDSGVTVGDPWHNNPSLKNFAPRIGVAWDPFGDGKTAVRAGFGIFYDEILPKYYFFSGSLNPPFTTRTSINNPSFPIITQGFDPNAPIRAQLQTVNFDLQTPYVMQFNLGLQRSLPGDVDVTVAYAGSRGNHLLRLGDANLAPESIVNGVKTYNPAAGRRNPNFAGVWQRVTDAQSFYHSAQLSAIKRYSAGLRAQVSYTFSRSIDDSSGINSQDFGNVVQYGLDWYDRTIDRGLSAFHIKHNLTFNWTYDLPFGRNLKGLAGALVKGWQLNNITAIQSGTPFTVRLGFNRSGNLNTTSFSANERPNLKAGASSNPILGDPNRYFDVNAFELPAVNTRGTLGRNTLIGPGVVNVDASLGKSFALGESRSLLFRAEVFNLPNHPNFAVPSGQIAFTNAQGAVAPTAGKITSTVTTSRQVQFGLKFTF